MTAPAPTAELLKLADEIEGLPLHDPPDLKVLARIAGKLRQAAAVSQPEVRSESAPALDPLEMLLDAARFIEHDKPGWAKSARNAVARSRAVRDLCPNGLEHGNCLYPDCVSSCPGRLGAAQASIDPRRLIDWTYLYATEGAGWPDYASIAEPLIKLAERAPTQDDAERLKIGATLKGLLALPSADRGGGK